TPRARSRWRPRAKSFPSTRTRATGAAGVPFRLAACHAQAVCCSTKVIVLAPALHEEGFPWAGSPFLCRGLVPGGAMNRLQFVAADHLPVALVAEVPERDGVNGIGNRSDGAVGEHGVEPSRVGRPESAVAVGRRG